MVADWESTIQAYRKLFKRTPELIVRAPGRINLIGEHTDYNNGLALPAAIDKELLIAVGKAEPEEPNSVYSIAFDQYHRSDQQNDSKGFNIGIEHILKVLNNLYGLGDLSINAAIGGDLPSGAGMSSSAALYCGMSYAVVQLWNLKLDRTQLARIARDAEHLAGVECGFLDQYAILFSREDHALMVDFDNSSFQEIPIDLTDHRFVLFNSNIKHRLADSAYNERKGSCLDACRVLEVPSLRQVRTNELKEKQKLLTPEQYSLAEFVLEENQRVRQAVAAVGNKNWAKLGALMLSSHAGLKNKYKVSCPELDFLVEFAMKQEAVLGARLMGGGFGGCTLNLIKKTGIGLVAGELEQQYRKRFNLAMDHYICKISGQLHHEPVLK